MFLVSIDLACYIVTRLVASLNPQVVIQVILAALDGTELNIAATGLP